MLLQTYEFAYKNRLKSFIFLTFAQQQIVTKRFLGTGIMMKEKIDQLLSKATDLELNGKTQEALETYLSILNLEEKHVEAQFMVGELNHKLGNLTQALSAYYRTTDIDPNHKKANVKIEMIKSIMDFFNPDLYNP